MRTFFVMFLLISGCANFQANQPDTLVGGAVVGGNSYSPGHQPELETIDMVQWGKDPKPLAEGREVVKGDSYSPGFQPDLETLEKAHW